MDRNWATFLPPWPAYRAVMWLATALDRMRDAIVPPQIRMMEVSTAFARTQVITCAQLHRDLKRPTALAADDG